MGKPSDKTPSELPPNELRKLHSRHSDLNGTSMCMNDKHLPAEAKELLRQQAHDSLHKDGWIEYESDTQKSPGVVKAAISIFTLGLF